MTPVPSSTRQTLSYLRNLFEERGIRPKNKLGQNFLIDLNLIDVLLRAAELTHDDLALEVGSGTGGLTVRLLDEAGTARDRVSLLHADVLKSKNEINPDVFRAIESLRERTGCTQVKLVANLP